MQEIWATEVRWCWEYRRDEKRADENGESGVVCIREVAVVTMVYCAAVVDGKQNWICEAEKS